MTTSPSATDRDRSPRATPTITTKNLTIRYGDKVALRDVSLTFEPGAITSILGPSGSGKTSFLTSLNRLTDLIPDCRVEGSIRIEELETLRQDTDVVGLRRRVGLIFQRPNLFPMSIRRNLELPLREHGHRNQTSLHEKIEQTLVEVGLWAEVKDRLNRSALTLSGGQQQRLCLARALVLEPEVLLLDEPCSALDPISTGVVEELLIGLRSRCTLIVVTHNLAQARRISDRSALLWSEGNGGRLIEAGETRMMFDSPRETMTEAYLKGQVG